MYEPAIKWSGSKRSQAKDILSYFPMDIQTYYEPFCGGCSVLRRLLDNVENGVNKVDYFVCSDINEDLINLWKLIKEDYLSVVQYYNELWQELNKDNDCERKKEFFEHVRTQLNEKHDPKDFMFIMRTTTNGMPRYNSSGEFNNSFHVTRNGILPEKLEKILCHWNYLLCKYNVEFICRDYREIMTNEKDVLYLDPPYASVKHNNMYFGGISLEDLFWWMRQQEGFYLLSFDGKSGEIDNTYSVPEDIYSKHIYLKSGNSSFKRTIGKSKDSIVYESLYIK